MVETAFAFLARASVLNIFKVLMKMFPHRREIMCHGKKVNNDMCIILFLFLLGISNLFFISELKFTYESWLLFHFP